mgnify:CR=1 FL=1
MSTHHGLNKINAAIKCLVEAGDIHARVRAAICQHLLHISPDSDVDACIRAGLQELIDDFHHDATEKINALSELEAEHLAIRIVSLERHWLESRL